MWVLVNSELQAFDDIERRVDTIDTSTKNQRQNIGQGSG